MNAAAGLLASVWVIVGVVVGLLFGLNIRSTSTRSAAWMQRHRALFFGARLTTTSAGLRVIGLIWALIAASTGVVLLTSSRG
jgi:hypothetical protein